MLSRSLSLSLSLSFPVRASNLARSKVYKTSERYIAGPCYIDAAGRNIRNGNDI
jgi:hypothetical protein